MNRREHVRNAPTTLAVALALASVWSCAPTAWSQQRLPPVSRVNSVATDPPSVTVSKPTDDVAPMLATERNPWSLDSEPQPSREEASGDSLDWWQTRVAGSLLDHPRWVSFDLKTVLLDALGKSPRIQSVSRRTSVALERIIQQDAAFDATLLLDHQFGRTNDPVGNSLVTGGPPRLIEQSFDTSARLRRTTRRGTELEVGQDLDFLDSNSNFFEPAHQANTRLSLSLTQPLLDRSGRVYNERLLTQARIDGSITWQEMRGEVEQRISDVVAAYWRLYELRCNLTQQRELLRRGREIQVILRARGDFDASQIELAKAQGRVARRVDRLVQLEAEIAKQQVELASLVGARELSESNGTLEMIPHQAMIFPPLTIDLHDAVLQGLENRPEIRAAASELESAALSIRVTRAELVPQLNAVVNTYLAGLRGNNKLIESIGDQFSEGAPGVTAGLVYEMPVGRRAARSRYREAGHLYAQRSEELRETMLTVRAEIESALITTNLALAQQQTRKRLLVAAIEEERVLTRRWQMMGGDGAAVGTVLENLLDAQQRRTDAEREWTAAQTRYLTSLVELQRTMGTLLYREGIQPVRDGGDTTIHFLQASPSNEWNPDPIEPAMPRQLSQEEYESYIDEEVNR